MALPFMNKDLWRWIGPDGQQREGRLEELRATLAGGHIAPTTPVWRADWQMPLPAHDVPELSVTGSAPDIPPPPAAMLAVLQQYENSAPPPARESSPSAPTAPSSGRALPTQIGGSAYGAVVVPSATAPRPLGPRLGPSLPTMIGTAPPPEVSARGGLPKSLPPPIPGRAPLAASPTNDPADDSARTMLDSAALIEEGPIGAGELAAPTEPMVHDFSHDGTLNTDSMVLPIARSPLAGILEDIKALREGRPPKNKVALGIAAAASVSLLVMLVAGVVSIASGSSSSTTGKKSASATPSASVASKLAVPAVSASASASAAAAPVEAPAPKSDTAAVSCRASGDSVLVAPRAVVGAGLEAQLVEGSLALGFAAAGRDAVAMYLDTSALTPTKTVHAKVATDARRVTPVLTNGKLVAMVDADRKKDPIKSRRTVPAKNVVDVGVTSDAVVWAAHGKDAFSKLFSLDGDGRVEALRVGTLPDRSGFALAFRQGNAVRVGVAKGETSYEASGALASASGLGQVGTPALAASGERVLVAWAERADASSDWKIRLAKKSLGGDLESPTTFVLPGGGLGGQAMSPALTALPGGRFLLSWTEGVVSNHQVRAITLDADGKPAGDAFAISRDGVNAGQPAAVVGTDGRGFVAFLAAKGKSFEVHATPIGCAAR